MLYSALIDKDGVCLNAMSTAGQASLKPSSDQLVIQISQQQYEANPIGSLWDGFNFTPKPEQD